MEEVYRYCCLWYQPIPEVEGKLGVDGDEPRYKVIIVCLYGAFGEVTPVNTSGYELEVDSFCLHVVFDHC